MLLEMGMRNIVVLVQLFEDCPRCLRGISRKLGCYRLRLFPQRMNLSSDHGWLLSWKCENWLKNFQLLPNFHQIIGSNIFYCKRKPGTWAWRSGVHRGRLRRIRFPSGLSFRLLNWLAQTLIESKLISMPGAWRKEFLSAWLAVLGVFLTRLNDVQMAPQSLAVLDFLHMFLKGNDWHQYHVMFSPVSFFWTTCLFRAWNNYVFQKGVWLAMLQDPIECQCRGSLRDALPRKENMKLPPLRKVCKRPFQGWCFLDTME